MPQPAQSYDRLSPELVEKLRCPVTGSRLRLDGDWLVAVDSGLAYPVRDGIPVLVPESAKLPPGSGSLEEFKRRR